MFVICDIHLLLFMRCVEIRSHVSQLEQTHCGTNTQALAEHAMRIGMVLSTFGAFWTEQHQYGRGEVAQMLIFECNTLHVKTVSRQLHPPALPNRISTSQVPHEPHSAL